MKKEDKIKEEIVRMLDKWLDNDDVMASWYFNKIEKGNRDFLRGWRYGIACVIRKLNE